MKNILVTVIALLASLMAGFYYLAGPEQNTLDATEREALGGNYVELSDGTTHYQLAGPASGKVVVLVHGGTVPMWAWEHQTRVLNAAGFRTLVYDKFGRGYSDRPAVTYDRSLYQRQLLELVDKLGITQKFHLVGVSLGGATSANFTASYPDRVDKLVLISPIIKDYKVPGIFKVPVIGELAARFIGVKKITNRFVDFIAGHPDAKRYTSMFVQQTTYKGFRQSLLSLLRNDALGDYSNAYDILGIQKQQPLLLWGTADAEITSEMMDRARELVPYIKFKSIGGAGHGLFMQQPEIVYPLIREFLLSNNV